MHGAAREVREAPDDNEMAMQERSAAREGQYMSQITEFLVSHGVLLLFLVGFVEQSGIPIPAAPWLLAAGALSASDRFSLSAAMCCTAAGCVAADAIWFYAGQRGSARVLRVFPHLHAVRARLHRTTLTGSILHGTRMLTVAKFLPFGTVVPLHAGAMDVGLLRFLLVDSFTSVVYAAVYVSLGFTFHNQLEQVAGVMGKLGGVSLLLIVVLAGAYYALWYHKQHRKTHPGQ